MHWLRLLFVAFLAIAVVHQPTPPPPRALWLWEPTPLFSDRDARAGFFDFCEHHGIGIVWAQIATRIDGSRRHLDRAGEWKHFLTEAHRRLVKVHALDGDPQYARRAQHAVPLSIIDAVIAYNASAAATERFDGIHFDNEPYALLEWNDPVPRERLLADYLDLNEQAEGQVKRAGGLEYGVDIPFWWNARDDETGEPIGITTFRGVRAVASDRLLAMVDNVGIMDYRTTAAGPDGIVAHARETLQAADRISNARVYVGVETSVERGEYWFVPDVPRAAIRAAAASKTPIALLLDRRRARLIRDGAVVHVGIKASVDAVDAVVELARAFNLAVRGDAASATASATTALRREGEWLDIQPRTIDARDGSTFTALTATHRTPSRITFAGRSLIEMQTELAAAETDLAAYRKYAGIAIHEYTSYRRIADASR